MDTITAALATAYPSTNLDHGARVARLHSELVGSTTALTLLMAAAVFVLLIVCANVGGLMVAKAAARENELAVRFSLGAGRGRLLLQLLGEHLPLAFLGGALGAVMARWALDGLRFLVPRSPAGGNDYRIDPWTLAVVTGLALCTAVLIGVAPALAASRSRLASSLNQGRGSLFTTPGRARVYRALIVVQLALTLVLANGAALMITSYLKLQRSHHGFDPSGVTAVSLHLAGPGYESAEQVVAYFRQLLTRVRSLPGVEVAATTTKLPLIGGTNGRLVIEGREGDWGEERGPLAERSLINPGYFRALGVPLRQGTLLEDRDLVSESPVAIINESMARLGWPDSDPIGGRFALDDDHQWITVIGVVADIRQWGAEQPPLPEYYLPFGPHPAYWAGWSFRAERTFLMLKTDVPVRSLLEPLKREIRAVSPEQPVSEVRSMDELVASMTVRRRFNTLLISTFAAIGLVLVAMGVFGMMSTFVTQRRHEIGVRMALGADVKRVIGLILGYSSRLLAIGVAAGLIGLLASTRLLATLLYAVSPTDPAILVGGSALVVVVGLIGAVLPALRAARVEPVAALRNEH
jgi:predicted permease